MIDYSNVQMGSFYGNAAENRAYYSEEELLKLFNEEGEEETEEEETEEDDDGEVDVSAMSSEEKYDLVKEIIGSTDDVEEGLKLAKKIEKLCENARKKYEAEQDSGSDDDEEEETEED